MDRDVYRQFAITAIKTVAAIFVAVLVIALCAFVAMLIEHDMAWGLTISDRAARMSLLLSVGGIVGIFLSRRLCDRLFPGYSRLWVMIVIVVAYGARLPGQVISQFEAAPAATALHIAPFLSIVLAGLVFFRPVGKALTTRVEGPQP